VYLLKTVEKYWLDANDSLYATSVIVKSELISKPLAVSIFLRKTFIPLLLSNVGYRPQPNECTHCREREIIFLFFIAISRQ